MRITLIPAISAVCFGMLVACGGGEPDHGATLGPHDGFDLPPTDLDRVLPGGRAPDFTLESSAGERYTLSEQWREREVILVFFRGHW